MYEVNQSKDIIKQKAAQVDAIAAELTACSSAVLVDYRGATVEEMTTLRSQCRAAGTTVRVLKNTLVLRAAEKCGIDCSDQGIEPSLHGPTAVFYSFDDPAAAARILRDFMAKAKKMSVK
ncbi:MAG: 50S ribosomal protein L10, partial [Clostridia bacterium]|nr:50S ribosomal protein L10 [Clostridia bacterium]